jgi:hypothetical protein
MALFCSPGGCVAAISSLTRDSLFPDRVAITYGLQFHPSHSQTRIWWLYLGLRLAYTLLTYQCCSEIFFIMYRPLEWDVIGHEKILKQSVLKARVISVAASLLSILIGAHT